MRQLRQAGHDSRSYVRHDERQLRGSHAAEALSPVDTRGVWLPRGDGAITGRDGGPVVAGH